MVTKIATVTVGGRPVPGRQPLAPVPGAENVDPLAEPPMEKSSEQLPNAKTDEAGYDLHSKVAYLESELDAAQTQIQLLVDELTKSNSELDRVSAREERFKAQSKRDIDQLAAREERQAKFGKYSQGTT